MQLKNVSYPMYNAFNIHVISILSYHSIRLRASEAPTSEASSENQFAWKRACPTDLSGQCFDIIPEKMADLSL